MPDRAPLYASRSCRTFNCPYHGNTANAFVTPPTALV